MSIVTTMSTMQKSMNTRVQIANQDKEVQRAQKELTTGLKADVYADGSFRGAQSLDLRNRMARTDAYAVSNKLLLGKLDIMNKAIGNVRTGAQDFLSLAVSLSGRGQGDQVLATSAKALMDQVSSYLNTVYAGEYLFAGQDRATASLTLPAEGLSTANLPASATLAQTQAEIANIDAYFGLSGGALPAVNYFTEAYPGSMVAQVAQVDDNAAVSYGITGGDESVRQLLKGLSMLSQVDASTLADGQAYDAWTSEAIDAVTKGITGLQAAEIDLGNVQTLVANRAEHQDRLGDLYNNRIVDIEGVDSYEAATRFEALSAQLEASYAVTVRLKNLSLLNFL